jgi:type IV pilus assembly protein PilV
MHLKPLASPTITTSGGSSLLEVLVTMVILSIGLLGYAGMQLSSMRSTEMGRMRSTVIALAGDIAERLQANRAEARQGGYDGEIEARTAADCSLSACSRQQLRDHDLSAWRQQLRSLPAGRGHLSSGSTTMTISLCWNEQRREGVGAGCPPNGGDAEPQLYQLRVML